MSWCQYFHVQKKKKKSNVQSCFSIQGMGGVHSFAVPWRRCCHFWGQRSWERTRRMSNNEQRRTGGAVLLARLSYTPSALLCIEAVDTSVMTQTSHCHITTVPCMMQKAAIAASYMYVFRWQFLLRLLRYWQWVSFIECNAFYCQNLVKKKKNTFSNKKCRFCFYAMLSWGHLQIKRAKGGK